MKASVIIATYGRDGCLVDTIHSVLLQDYPDFELIIVDQTAKHSPEVEAFLRNRDNPRYSYCLVTPPSLPAARNFGVARSTGEIVIFVDDDVLLDPGFIHAHVNAYNRSERIAAVGGRVRSGPISSQLPAIIPKGVWEGGLNYPGTAEELQTVMGCNMSLRRSVLKEIGGFDPSYVGNALREETDVCCRLRRAGYQIWYEPGAALDHLVASSGGCREKEIWHSSVYYQNETLFYLRHMGLLFFCRFLLNSFRSHVWPYKQSFMFWSSLKALAIGVLRGIRLAFFPIKLQSSVVWELNRTGDVREPSAYCP